MSVTVTYRVQDLSGIALLFQQNAQRANSLAANAKTLRDKRLHEREANTWNNAARIVLSMTIDPTQPPQITANGMP